MSILEVYDIKKQTLSGLYHRSVQPRLGELSPTSAACITTETMLPPAISARSQPFRGRPGHEKGACAQHVRQYVDEGDGTSAALSSRSTIKPVVEVHLSQERDMAFRLA
jgi:hypothetical protein